MKKKKKRSFSQSSKTQVISMNNFEDESVFKEEALTPNTTLLELAYNYIRSLCDSGDGGFVEWSELYSRFGVRWRFRKHFVKILIFKLPEKYPDVQIKTHGVLIKKLERG